MQITLNNLLRSHTLTKNNLTICCLLCSLLFVLFGCTKEEQPSTHKIKSNNFVVADLKVINTSFSTGINTPQSTLLAGGDGSIIFSIDNTHWQAANTSGISDNFTNLSANEHGSELVATGENGLVAYSNNTGKDWQKILQPVTQHLYASAYDIEHRSWVAVGAQGTLLLSKSPAKEWQPVALPENAKLAAITTIHYSPTLQSLLVTGDQGLLIQSHDGGKSWGTIDSNSVATLNAQIHLADAIIILGSDGSILLSNNEINNWEKIEINNDSNLIKGVYDSTHKIVNIISSRGEIYISDDNGKNWGISYSANQTLRSISYSEKYRTLVAAGSNGGLFYSDNGGRVWNKITVNITGDFESLIALSNGDILALGTGGLIASSIDGGKKWKLLQESITAFIHQISESPDEKSLITTGANGLLLNSTDHGNSWQTVSPPVNNKDYLFSLISDKKSQTLIAAGSPGTIIRSTNNSHTWQVQLALGDANQGYFHKLIRNNKNTIVALAGPGTSYYSNNMGETWQPANINNKQHLFNGIFDGVHNRFVAVGNAGVIQLSENGKDWRIIDAGISNNLQGIYAFDNTLWATGSNGIILRSSDGGEHWKKITSNTSTAIQYLLAIPQSNTIIATGLNGLILRSTDSGDTWQTIINPEHDNLREPVCDNGTGIIYLSSRSGNILFSRDAGEHWELMPRLTQLSIKGLIIDEQTKTLIGYGERIIRVPLLK
jgi:photosystem II stability/assembly factor-like uncharacterized protein